VRQLAEARSILSEAVAGDRAFIEHEEIAEARPID
jgi:hypothetical protein